MAGAARSELSRREEAHAEEERERTRQRQRQQYDKLAKKRANLEAEAQRAVEDLAGKLDKLSSMDREMRAVGDKAGIFRGRRRDLRDILQGWLSAHLPHVEGVPRPESRRPLHELSPLPDHAPTDAEVKEAQDRDARRRAAREERDEVERELQTLTDEVDRERTIRMRTHGSDIQTQTTVDTELAQEYGEQFQRLRDRLDEVEEVSA